MGKTSKNRLDKTSTSLISPLELGKMPPQNTDLEEVVLGALLLEKDAIVSVIDIISPESFYVDAHQKIFKAIIDLFTTDRPIDIMTVSEELKRQELLDAVGGAYYIAQLTSRVASSANIEYHARIIQQKYIQRELIRISSEIQTKAYDESIDVNDLLDFSEAQLFEIVQGNIKKETLPLNLLLSEAIKQIEEAGKREDHLSGIPSGYTKLDNMTLGWQNSDLIIVAARPSMGKTAFVLSMARNMSVEYNKSVAIFSLEMSSMQLVNRLISIESEISSTKIRKGNLRIEEWRQLNNKIKALENAKIYIDDTPGISIFELRAKCRRLKKKYNIDIVIIDYLQLMAGPSDVKGNREQEVSIISRSLKGLAKELNIPVIALSQLNRAVESRTGNKRPQLSDLRESGAIEQDADVVCFIHRPEKYGMLVDDEGNSLVGIAEIIVAKHRNGAVGDIRLRFRDEIARFVDLEEIQPLDDNLSIRPVITKGSKMNDEIDSFSSNFKPNSEFDNDTPF